MTEEPSREQQLRTRVITTPIETMVRMMIISAQDGQDDGLDDDDIYQICSRGQLMVTSLKIRKFALTLIQAQGTMRVQQKKR